MILPELGDSTRLRGLYVFDFGEWTAVGYTADEIAVLLEQESYRDGRVYRIHRAQPDGQMELRGVSAARFGLESGIFFYRNNLQDARHDFECLRNVSREQAPPCRATLHLADRSADSDPQRYVVALVYPAEYEDDISSWLLAIGFAGGDLVEGGTSHVSNYQNEPNTIIDRQQLWSQNAIQSRCREEVLATVRQAVQR